MDKETRSELVVIFRENRDKARIRKAEMKTRVDELKIKLASLEKEIRELDNIIVEAVN